MARYLGLDWDNTQLHVVVAATGLGGTHIEKAVVVRDDFSPKPGQAEAVGQRLRETLKAAGIGAAAAIACIGRDRVIVKEVRYPQVPASEEPALIRFQAMKEMTDAGDGTVIDYTARGAAAGNPSERIAFAFAVRRDLPAFLQAVCRAAGIKLLAVTPRGFGVAGCLKRATGAVPANAIAVLTAAEGWADFSVVRGESLLFTRALPVNGNLAAEVRRNLAAYAGQTRSTPADAIRALHVAGGAEQDALREQLRQNVSVPVHALDPFAREPALDVGGAGRGGFTAAVGLVETWAAHKSLPVNFLRPKEPVKAADPNRKRNLQIAAVAAGVLLVVAFACYWILSEHQERLAELRDKEAQYEASLKALQPDSKHIQALKEWTGAAVPWLDELYEVTARFPSREGFRVTELYGAPRPQSLQQGQRGNASKVKEKYNGLLTLNGETRPIDEREVEGLKAALNDAQHRTVEISIQGGGGVGATKKDIRVFKLKTDVAGQPSNKYTTRFDPPRQVKRPSNATPNFDGFDDGGLP